MFLKVERIKATWGVTPAVLAERIITDEPSPSGQELVDVAAGDSLVLFYRHRVVLLLNADFGSPWRNPRAGRAHCVVTAMTETITFEGWGGGQARILDEVERVDY